MTYKNTRRGFTLIELLVVVLIIGILAAVALPQYNKAVDKARVYAQLPKLKAVAEAVHRCYLEKGEFSSIVCRNIDPLDIDIETTCDPISGTQSCNLEWGTWAGYRQVRLNYRMKDGSLYFEYPVYTTGVGSLRCYTSGAPTMTPSSDACPRYGFKLVDGKYILQ